MRPSPSVMPPVGRAVPGEPPRWQRARPAAQRDASPYLAQFRRAFPLLRGVCCSETMICLEIRVAKNMKTKDVFTPGKYPEVTFIADHLQDKTRHLKDAIEAGGLVVSLSGPSKSGKTVFVENVIGKDSLIHVTGAGIDQSSRLWQRVFDIIGTPTSTTETQSKGFQGTLSGKAGGDIGFIIKGKAEVGASGAWNEGTATSETRPFDQLHAFIKDVKNSGFVLFIDDFHYVASSAQQELAEEIKECIRQGITVICASVPYHSEDVIRANKDLRGRLVLIDFDYWTPNLLVKIGEAGFRELRLNVAQGFIQQLAAEAAGSPQLMQSLCLNLCFELGVYESLSEERIVENDDNLFKQVCRRTALMADYSATVGMMKEGPKTRGQARQSHQLKGGAIVDVYPIVLRALAQSPPKLTFRYNDLLERIRTLCETEGPVGSSVTGACAHMSKLANDSSKDKIVEWDATNDVLDIRDPYFLFYIRWYEN